jgi:hypothetical protein
VVLPVEARDWALQNGLRLPPTGAYSSDDDTVRLLSPDPYTEYEISPITPRETQRLRFHVAAPADTVSVTYLLNGAAIGTSTEDDFSLWWEIELGEWELVAQATLSDGRVLESAPIPFSVVDYEPAEPHTIFPGGGN